MFLSIDQGTSSTKACVFAPPGELVGAATVPVATEVLADGSIVQDPRELAQSCRDAARSALRAAGIGAEAVVGAAIANQGESFLFMDPKGRPLTPVISWQDGGTGTVLERPELVGHADEITRRTGLAWHPEFVAPRATYRLEQLGRAGAGARLATLDTWLMHELDPRRPFVTDRATASRTMLLGLDDGDWDPELLDWFGLPRGLLAEIVPCDEVGAHLVIDRVEIPLRTSCYDMGLALLGHGCLRAGQTKATFGTCLGVMTATGAAPVVADGLLTTMAYQRGDRPAFALDGEIAAAGALVTWACGLGLAGSLAEIDQLISGAPDAAGVVMVPAILGLGAPHWDQRAQATISGLTVRSGRAELAHAIYDAIAWSLHDVMRALEAAGVVAEEIRVDGGLTRSHALMQRCADVTQAAIVVSAQPEATAYGGAALAMLGRGLITEEDIRGVVGRGAVTFSPGSAPPAEAHARWDREVRRARGFESL